jgi:hypothetical protein
MTEIRIKSSLKAVNKGVQVGHIRHNTLRKSVSTSYRVAHCPCCRNKPLIELEYNLFYAYCPLVMQGSEMERWLAKNEYNVPESLLMGSRFKNNTIKKWNELARLYLADNTVGA